MKCSILCLGLVIVLFNFINIYSTSSVSLNTTTKNGTSNHSDYKLITWKFNELRTYFIFGNFIIIVVIMKIIYYHLPQLASHIPESCILLVIGTLFGVVLRFTLSHEKLETFKLTPELFFYILLPPIVLESAYSLYNRHFLDNIFAILMFAVCGTILNFLLIGYSLYGFGQVGSMKSLNMTVKSSLLFSSLIVAVDPVAVLSIFQDIGVNQNLYYLVFGESLLNDAVTVVLYEIMQEFSMISVVSTKNIVLGVISFFTVSFGGVLIGLVMGVITCFILRFMSNKETEIFEPILLFSMGYLSYVITDIFSWSGIIGATVCGIVQVCYGLNGGVSDKSRLTFKRFNKIISSICEAAIFLYLGIELSTGKLKWHTGFSLTALSLCLVVRFIVTFVLASFINKIHINIHEIPFREKFIMSFGGLRGAVAFSLAVLLKEKALADTLLSKDIIITTTLFIILFTVFVQGILMKPLVTLLKITLQDVESKQLSLFYELNESVQEAVDVGLEAIQGKSSRNYFYMLCINFNKRFIKPYLQRYDYSKINHINDKINMILLAKMVRSNSQLENDVTLNKLPDNYKTILMNMRKQKGFEEPSEDSSKDVKVVYRRINSLKPILIRASSISLDYVDNQTIFNGDILNFMENSTGVIKAKNRFLQLKKSNKKFEIKRTEDNLLNETKQTTNTQL